MMKKKDDKRTRDASTKKKRLVQRSRMPAWSPEQEVSYLRQSG